jgi:NhaP-type Na+/H+ or K+/H+ antiporter
MYLQLINKDGDSVDELPWFYYLAGVPLLGVIAQWLAWRLRLPAILLLLGFGMLLGLFVHPDQMLAEMTGSDLLTGPKLLFPVVSLAVAAILFEGGLTLKFHELRDSGHSVFRLVTIGAIVSWCMTAGAAYWLLQLQGRLAVLLGAVLVVTGPTVVVPLLKHIQPAKRIGSVLKWEGIVIDPVGAILAVLTFEQLFIAAEHASGLGAVVLLIRTIAIGVAGGLLGSILLAHSLKRYWLPDFLHGVAFLTFGLGAFAISNLLQPESGLLTITILGIALANRKDIRMDHILEFKEHLGVLLISCLFIVLGSRLHLEDLLAVGPRGVLFLAVLILVIRPVSVFASTIGGELTWQERAFLSFLAPRGIVAAAVASVFALKMATLESLDEELVQQADRLVPLTFLVIVGTVSIYGLLAGPLARRLGLADPNPQGILFAGADAWIRQVAAALHNEGITVMLVDTNYANVAAAKMDGLPADCTSILSEHVQEELDLGGIGRFLSMTPNSEINTLAVREFVHRFGRANCYQLAPPPSGSGKRTHISQHLRGRILFGEEYHFTRLAYQFSQGAVVKKTQLTKSFSYDDFLKMYGPSALLLFWIDENKKLRICTAEQQERPAAGDAVIAVVEDTNQKPQ